MRVHVYREANMWLQSEIKEYLWNYLYEHVCIYLYIVIIV